ncbi:MAG: penicillin acylase family protein [Georgenia sp.]
MSVSRKVLLVVAGLLAVALVVTAGLVVALVRRPLPDYEGEQTLEILDGEVEIVRDAQGVPRIYATTDEDLMRGQGYVHAQDRFFEMDYRRHVTAGRLSKLVGANEAALAADQVVRTLGWRRAAEQEWDLLEPETRTLYEAYADGVNAYLEGREASRLGIEYTVLGMTTTLDSIEPWTPIDSLAWGKAMAWDLAGNYDAELGRAAALRPLAGDVARVEQLYPDYPYDTAAPIVAPPQEVPSPIDGPAPGAAPPTAGAALPTAGAALPTGAAPDTAPSGAEAPDPAEREVLRARGAAAAAVSAVPTLLGTGDGIGSNSFVVAGEHTSTGGPLLANDPHLSLGVPSVWHQSGLHCVETGPECTFDVSGFGFAGAPGIVIGQNADLAWGLTNLGADVMDLTLERVYDDATYLRGGERVPLVQRRETIAVDGEDPVVITVASTVHGPIISTVLPDSAAAGSTPVPDGSPSAGFSGYAVALQWTALTPGRVADAVFALDRAATAQDVAAAAALFEAPAQNIVFATTDGDIGYQATGRIPVRAAVPGAPVPADGSWPRPGWDERYDWQGFVDPAQMPAVLNPADGFVVAANQAANPAGEGPFITSDWDAGYRAARLRALVQQQIGTGEKFDVAAMNDLMLDDASPFGRAVVPALLQVDVDDDFVAQAVDLLRTWSAEGFPTAVDSPGAAYFNAVWATMLDLTFADDLPAGEAPDGGGRWLQVVTTLLEDPQNPWWDDRTTINVVEGRDEIIRQSLVSARQQLTNVLGKDPQDWEWGRLHQVRLEHPVLGGPTVPAPVRRLVNPDPVEAPGGGSVVDALAYDAAAEDARGRPDYTVTAGPSMRMVVDLADRDASTWVVGTGVSGHPASGYYSDQLAAWAVGETYPWPADRAAVTAAAQVTLVLRPPE